MSDPSLWDAVERDPAMPLDAEVIGKVADDQRRWTRTWLYPLARPFSRVTVVLILLAKRCLPVRVRAHGTMDRLCLWFLRHFVSPLAVELLIRHFVIETNLLNFIVRNAGATGARPVSLRPTTLAGLGNRAVIEHDINVYDVLGALGPGPMSPAMLDFAGLDMPPLDTEPHRRRAVNLDVQTALCLMNVPFALCLTPEEYRRAVHSMRFDDSILAILADLTGDATFLRWRSGDLAVRVDSNTDVPAAVYRHAVICEYAHAQLVRLAARAEPTGGERRSAGMESSSPVRSW
ncbi:DUF6999 family protein [Phytomonospora endophytica]|uniref:Uncharacterized protein n=1 Tax=Phytomonospora endophytica TaxID=714109 RepID=A0A841FJ45_9ACTN|nr:hypothetical protein [Phytomonospora endophytica]MBB6032669.1 hypothetical protein [Phytomonospora endophytica]GIG66181.1 hypothetical protein Pen01_24760 [Phytomonospora endophytica]